MIGPRREILKENPTRECPEGESPRGAREVSVASMKAEPDYWVMGEVMVSELVGAQAAQAPIAVEYGESREGEL